MKLFAAKRLGDMSRIGMLVALALSLAWMKPQTSHVSPPLDAGPAPLEDASAEGVDLDLADALVSGKF